MLTAQIAAALAVLTISVLVPLAAPAFDVPATWIGGFTSIVYLFGAVSGTMTGDLIRRFGAIRITQLALMSSAIGLMLFATAEPLFGVLAAAFLGISYGQLNPTSADVLVRCTPASLRPLVFSVKQTGVVFGGVLAGALAPICAQSFGWSGASLLVAVMVATVVVLLNPLRRRFDLNDDRQPPNTGRRRGFNRVIVPVRSVLSNVRLKWLAIASLGFSGIQVCLAAFLVLFMTDFYQLSLEMAGGLYAMNQVAGVLGRIAWGYLSGRCLSARGVLAAIAAISVLSLVALATLSDESPIISLTLIVILLGISGFGWNGVLLSEVSARVEPDAVGDATGGVQFVFFGGVVVIPPVFGLIIGWLGYAAAFLALAGLATLTFCIIAFFFDDQSGGK